MLRVRGRAGAVPRQLRWHLKNKKGSSVSIIGLPFLLVLQSRDNTFDAAPPCLNLTSTEERLPCHYHAYRYTTATLRIGKATNPFLVFVAPKFFEFYVLGFGIHHLIHHIS